MDWNTFNRLLAGVVILLNLICFYWQTGYLIYTGGGAMGFGLLILPTSFLANLLSIPAFIVIFKKSCSQKIINLNLFGVVWCATWFAITAIGWTF